MPEIMCAHIGLKGVGGKGVHSIKLDIRQLVPPYMSLRAHLGNLTYHDFRETCQRDHKGNTQGEYTLKLLLDLCPMVD